MKNKCFSWLMFALLAMGSSAAWSTSAEDNYKNFCWQCHGMAGNGMGVNVQDMSVQPRDHTSAKAMGGRSDADLFKVIKQGGLAIDKSVLMPPWGDSLSDEEIRDLVKYLRKLCKCG
ncbi:MAG TPA: cytochrome c [Gammaproteobacteria bacterium]|nr:cytochrome c [Gammaproteobacteria bacterium]